MGVFVQVRQEIQQNPVAEEVSALIAVTRPILAGMLHSVGEEYLAPHGGREGIQLKQLGRVRKSNDGDIGVAFEYAVHDALVNRDPVVMDRVRDAIKRCKIKDADPESILFAMEKTGSKQLIDTRRELITDHSRVLSGTQGRPIHLKSYLNMLTAAFHRPSTRLALPTSIRGLWKADLFVGASSKDQWVGTSIKVNPKALEGAAGLRVAIVPLSHRGSDKLYKDEAKNLIVCPLPHDFSFMQKFYEGMRIIQALMDTDFKEPKPVDIPHPQHREVARVYWERRDFSVVDVLQATAKFAQPELLSTSEESPDIVKMSEDSSDTSMILAPMPMLSRSN